MKGSASRERKRSSTLDKIKEAKMVRYEEVMHLCLGSLTSKQSSFFGLSVWVWPLVGILSFLYPPASLCRVRKV